MLDPRELVRRSGLAFDLKVQKDVARLQAAVADLQRAPKLQTGAGAPTSDPTTLRNGTLYLDLTNERLYVVSKNPIGGANIWRWTPMAPWVGNGAPPVAANTVLEGTQYIDRAGTGRLYFAVNGAWRSVALA